VTFRCPMISPMARDRRQLGNSLRRLGRAKATWQGSYTEPAEFWPACRQAGQIIADTASPEDQAWVVARIES